MDPGSCIRNTFDLPRFCQALVQRTCSPYIYRPSLSVRVCLRARPAPSYLMASPTALKPKMAIFLDLGGMADNQRLAQLDGWVKMLLSKITTKTLKRVCVVKVLTQHCARGFYIQENYSCAEASHLASPLTTMRTVVVLALAVTCLAVLRSAAGRRDMAAYCGGQFGRKVATYD